MSEDKISETAVAVVDPKPRSVIVDMADRFGMEPAPFEATLRATVCKGGITREEFAAFLLVAKEYNLNPLTKEIFAFPAKGGGIVPVVSIDGWCRIINDHKNCDGIEFADHLKEGGELTAITARIYRKDRTHATEVTEYMEECKGTTDVWKRWPRRMLRHKALIQAARYAFGFSGIYDEDEFDRMEQARDVTPQSSGVMGRLSGAQEGNGFDNDAVQAQTEAPEKPKRTRKAAEPAPAPEPAAPEPEAAEATPEPVSQIPADDEVLAVVEPEPEVEELAEEAQPALDAPPGPEQDAAIAEIAEEIEAEAVTEEDPDEGLPVELRAFKRRIENADAWDDVTAAMKDFYNTETFAGFTKEQQSMVRATTWNTCVERNIQDIPDHANSLTAYRLWLESCDDPEAIKGTLGTLQRGDVWASVKPETHKVIHAATEARLAALA